MVRRAPLWWVCVAASVYTVVACGPVRIETSPEAPLEKDVLKGEPRLGILPPQEPRYQHVVTVVLSGRPSSFEYSLYILAVQEGNLYRLALIRPATQRVYRFEFVPVNPPRTLVCEASLWTLRGFDIYGTPVPLKRILQTRTYFDASLLTWGVPSDNVGTQGGSWQVEPY